MSKPKNSLVRSIFDKIRQQESRPGFLSECESLCGDFGIPISRVAPADRGDPQPLSEFGDELKQELYHTSFQRDLARVKDSRQAAILASLFPPNSSYFSYKPLDLMTRVLNFFPPKSVRHIKPRQQF